MSEYIYCGFWRRISACLVDGVILMLLTIMLSLAAIIVAILLFDTSVFSDNYSIDNLFNDLNMLVILSPIVFYIPIFESSSMQATPGCYILGMKIINKNGKRIGYFKSFTRALLINLTCISIFTFILFGIGNILCIMLTDEKMFIHDWVFRTRMIRQ
ncbi:RDD family protein [Candidatus Tisiphia endosymbiont of Hybos culiciformis]|uniref:RDD family protein n=1 Tax=Candidatus Tisiphia endosymbiont of Hybos culiciformis TaxID=3139331 RepID=UPI003CCB00E4